jgi:two-component system, NarL family, invasion response regulator UvrY
MYTLAIADDHVLLREALVKTLNSFGHRVMVQAATGKELMEKLVKYSEDIDLVLLDIVMPEQNGFDTCRWIIQHKPLTKVLALSMNDDEASIMHILQCGARGFVSKNDEPTALQRAIDAVMQQGYYFNDLVTGKMIQEASNGNKHSEVELSDREKEFLQLNCSELTYKEIAQRMHLSPRTIENYRDALYLKFEVKSRLGLALLALKKGLVKL